MGEGGASDPAPRPTRAGRVHFFIGPPEKILQKFQPGHADSLGHVPLLSCPPLVHLVLDP
jgi:hypothetical protein